MSVIFYHIFLLLFRAGAFISSLFNSKTKKWLEGRKGIFEKLQAAIPGDARIVWMHCSSLGEFEQGRPVLEKIRSEYPGYKILLTFFSPSGYEVQKDYAGADWVFYLPMDGRSHAKRFLEIVHPSLVIFVKYDLWYFYLKEIKKSNIPLLLISALVVKNSALFKWYGRLQRKMFRLFSYLFVQNSSSKDLLKEIGLKNVTVAGDTRYDRVTEIAEKFQPVPAIEQFIGSSTVLVAGSTWPEDEALIAKALPLLQHFPLCFIIAPHEIHDKEIARIRKAIPSITWTELMAMIEKDQSTKKFFGETDPTHRALIIDNFGMLSQLYKYGDITMVGGGMTSYGVHNVLEAAVFFKPVIIGPYYKKYIEAIGLVECGGALIAKNEREFAGHIQDLLTNERTNVMDRTSRASGNFVQQNTGAVNTILQVIQEKRLLTN